MDRSRLRLSGLLPSLLLALLLSALAPVDALYWYMDSTMPKCFFEELPKDTLVVGKLNPVEKRASGPVRHAI